MRSPFQTQRRSSGILQGLLSQAQNQQPIENSWNLLLVRQLVRYLGETTANSIFPAKQQLVQEAPDLCYQKVLTDLRTETHTLVGDSVEVSESFIVRYRAEILKKTSRMNFSNCLWSAKVGHNADSCSVRQQVRSGASFD